MEKQIRFRFIFMVLYENGSYALPLGKTVFESLFPECFWTPEETYLTEE
jgi:hypothetical protein